MMTPADPPTPPEIQTSTVRLADGAYVRSSSADDLSFDGTKPFTFSGWAVADAFDAPCVLVGRGGQYWLGLDAQGRLQGFRDSMSSPVTASEAARDGEWFHAAMTYDGETLTLFLNGREVGHASSPGSAGAFGDAALTVGAGGAGSPGRFFQGKLGRFEVRSYAAQPSEVENLMFVRSPPQPGLVANFDFSRIPASDRSGHEHPLTLEGGATYLLEAFGMELPETGAGFAQVVPVSGVGFKPPEDRFTVEGWIYPTVVPGTDDPPATVFLARSSEGELRIEITGGKIRVVAGEDTLTTPVLVGINQWYFLSVAYDGGTGDWTLYLNGSQVKSAPGTSGFQFPTGQMFVGGDPTDGGEGLVGYLQTLRLWRTARSHDQVKAWMRQRPVFQDDIYTCLGFAFTPASDQIGVYDVTLGGGAKQGAQTRTVKPSEASGLSLPALNRVPLSPGPSGAGADAPSAGAPGDGPQDPRDPPPGSGRVGPAAAGDGDGGAGDAGALDLQALDLGALPPLPHPPSVDAETHLRSVSAEVEALYARMVDDPGLMEAVRGPLAERVAAEYREARTRRTLRGHRFEVEEAGDRAQLVHYHPGGRRVLAVGRNTAKDKETLWKIQITITVVTGVVGITLGLQVSSGRRLTSVVARLLLDPAMERLLAKLVASVTVANLTAYATGLYNQGWLKEILLAIVAGITVWAVVRAVAKWALNVSTGWASVAVELAALAASIALLIQQRPTSKSKFTLTMYQAGSGDCLGLQTYVKRGDDPPEIHRMLVDAGHAGDYQRIAGVLPGELDALVVSHIDDDHIEGAVALLRAGQITVHSIWFNSPYKYYHVPPPVHSPLGEASSSDGDGHAAAGATSADAGEEGAAPAGETPADPGGDAPAPAGGTSAEDEEEHGHAVSHVVETVRSASSLTYLAQQGNIPLRFTQAGDAPRALGYVSLDILGPSNANLTSFYQAVYPYLQHPQGAHPPGPIVNRASIILRAWSQTDRVSILFTGDAWDRQEQGRTDIQRALNLPDPATGATTASVTFMKVPHHGSRTSEDAYFYAHVFARYYLISGRGNFPYYDCLQWIVEGNAAAGRSGFKIYVTNQNAAAGQLVQNYPPGQYGYEIWRLADGSLQVDFVVEDGEIEEPGAGQATRIG